MEPIKYRVENGSGLYGLETQQADGTWIAMVCPRFNVKSNKILTCGQWCPQFELVPPGREFYADTGQLFAGPLALVHCCGRVIELEPDNAL